jgi:potassium-transporting ATPase KdpC subunit
MAKALLLGLRMALFTLLVTGLMYPLAVTGVGQLLFRSAANGSLASNDEGRWVGSALIAQRFVQASYFQPRPSAAGDQGYDASHSSGSNLAPTSKKLHERVAAELERLRRENPAAGDPPADLLAASGSGLDPHISPEAALWQVARVARARGLAAERVRAVVEANTEGRDLGVLGEPRVNVLVVNLALNRQFGRPNSSP